jgi:hypothetical protein
MNISTGSIGSVTQRNVGGPPLQAPGPANGIDPNAVGAHELGHAHLGIFSGKYDRANL